MAHVKTNTYPLEVALRNTCVMLPELSNHMSCLLTVVMQSYPQIQSFLMDQLHEQKFISLLAYVPLDVVRICLHFCAGLVIRA